MVYVHAYTQIQKHEVDSIKRDKWIPARQLVAKSDKEQLTDIEHIVTLIGAKEPFNYFNINRPCSIGKAMFGSRVYLGSHAQGH